MYPWHGATDYHKAKFYPNIEDHPIICSACA